MKDFKMDDVIGFKALLRAMGLTGKTAPVKPSQGTEPLLTAEQIEHVTSIATEYASLTGAKERYPNGFMPGFVEGNLQIAQARGYDKYVEGATISIQDAQDKLDTITGLVDGVFPHNDDVFPEFLPVSLGVKSQLLAAVYDDQPDWEKSLQNVVDTMGKISQGIDDFLALAPNDRTLRTQEARTHYAHFVFLNGYKGALKNAAIGLEMLKKTPQTTMANLITAIQAIKADKKQEPAMDELTAMILAAQDNPRPSRRAAPPKDVITPLQTLLSAADDNIASMNNAIRHAEIKAAEYPQTIAAAEAAVFDGEALFGLGLDELNPLINRFTNAAKFKAKQLEAQHGYVFAELITPPSAPNIGEKRDEDFQQQATRKVGLLTGDIIRRIQNTIDAPAEGEGAEDLIRQLRERLDMVLGQSNTLTALYASNAALGDDLQRLAKHAEDFDAGVGSIDQQMKWINDASEIVQNMD